MHAAPILYPQPLRSSLGCGDTLLLCPPTLMLGGKGPGMEPQNVSVNLRTAQHRGPLILGPPPYPRACWRLSSNT